MCKNVKCRSDAPAFPDGGVAGGHAARWLFAARPEDAGQPAAHAGFFLLRRLCFSGCLGAYRFPFVPGGFLTSGFSVILSPFRVCGRCVLPVRFLPAPVTVAAACRACRGVLVLRLLPVRGLLAAGSLPLRFRIAGSLSLRLAPARPLSGLTLCGLFCAARFSSACFCPPVCAVSGFFPAGFSGCFVREPVPRNPGRVPVRSV